MPMVDLSDDDAALLEQAKKLGGAQGLDNAARAYTLHNKLFTHKDTASTYQPLIKKLFPDAQTDLDRAAPFVEPIDARIKALEEAETKRAADAEEAAKNAAQTDFESAFTQVSKDYELSDEGQDALLKFMQKHRIADPEAGALKYFKHNPKPPEPIAPTSIAPQTWGLGAEVAQDDKESKLLLNNPEGWADQEAAAVLTEIRRAA